MLRIGVSVFPNRSGKQNPVFHSGWSETDAGGFVWLEGAVGELLLDMPPLVTDLMLEVDCFPVELTAPSPQRLLAYCNGMFIGGKFLRERQSLLFPIARDMCPTRQARVSLVPGLVEVPKLAGRNPDERPLSVGVHAICLRGATSLAA